MTKKSKKQTIPAKRSDGVERRNILLWLLVITYAAAIFLLSSSPKPPSEGDIGLAIPFFDKIAHFFLYFGFAFMILRAALETGIESAVCFTYLIAILYSFSDEIHQYFVPNRSCDYLDFLVDSLGISISIYLVLTEKHINLMKNS